MQEQAIEKYLASIASTVDTQLLLCSASEERFRMFLDSTAFRGYLLGYFEAAIQRSDIPIASHRETLQHIATAHSFVLQCDLGVALQYLGESLDQQKHPGFAKARADAAQELRDFLDGKFKSPLGLAQLFREMALAEQAPDTSPPAQPIGSARQTPSPSSGDRRRAVFNDADLQIFERFCVLLRQTSGREGFFDVRPLEHDAACCGIGVLVRGKKVLLASIVGARKPNGFEYSVRNFQQQAVPGLPPLYDSVPEALAAHKAYFLAVVRSLREEAKPWWKRLLP